MITKRLWCLFSLCCIAVLSSCSNRDGNTADRIESWPRLTIISSLNGAGDNGYNDKIMAGIMQFYESYDVSMSLVQPTSIDDARVALRSWLEEQPAVPSMLVLLSSDYESMMKSEQISLGKNQKLLLFESDEIPNINTFRIQRYGGSYLAGCMASPHLEATVVAALPGEQTLADGIQGFTAGYTAHSGGRQASVLYLSDNNSGYAMPQKAYQIASKLESHFIYPLAGGSNNGLYKYSRERTLVSMLVAGMDTDCSVYSSRVPFSVVIKIDQIVSRYLSHWYQGLELPRHQTFGLASGMVDILISPLFYKTSHIWEEYYLDDTYWHTAYHQYKAEAMRKEAAYEANK